MLRDYQERCLEEVGLSLEESRTSLCVMPTGMGKTYTFAHLAKNWPYGNILIAAHRDELIEQAAQTIRHVCGRYPEIEKADQRASNQPLLGGGQRIICTSVQTQNSKAKNGPRRMERFDPTDFGLMIVDEAHRSVAPTYMRMARYYMQNEDLRLVGWTATPDRADEVALGNLYESVGYDMSLPEAVKMGWLVRPMEYFVEVQGLDLSEVKLGIDKDLSAGDLDRIMNEQKQLLTIAGSLVDICKGGKQALVFVPGIPTAEALAETINRYNQGVAVAVSMRTGRELRKALVDGFKAGEIQYLVNVDLFTEGFDHPGLDVVAIARPTKSRAKYAQMIGRGSRVLPNIVESDHDGSFSWRVMHAQERVAMIAASRKPSLMVVDYVGVSGRHQLVCLADILGGNDIPDDVVAKARENMKAKGGSSDAMFELERAEKQVQKERELAAKKAQMTAKVQYRLRVVQAFDTLGIVPPRQPAYAKQKPASDRQKAALDKFRVPYTPEITFQHASKLLDVLVGRAIGQKATYRQLAFLKSRGVEKLGGTPVEDATFAQARQYLNEVSQKEGWKKRRRR